MLELRRSHGIRTPLKTGTLILACNSLSLLEQCLILSLEPKVSCGILRSRLLPMLQECKKASHLAQFCRTNGQFLSVQGKFFLGFLEHMNSLLCSSLLCMSSRILLYNQTSIRPHFCCFRHRSQAQTFYRLRIVTHSNLL